MLVRVSTVTVRNNLICPTLPCSWRNDFLWDTCSSDGRLVKEFSSVSRGVKPLSLSIGSRSSTILYFRSHNGTGQVELFKEVIHIDSFQRKTIHRTGGRSRQTFDFDTCHGRTDFHFGILVTVRYSRGIRQGRTTGSPALPYAPGITDGDKYAEVEIGPAVARVEIEGLATTASSAVDGFTLEGIYVNNFFEKFNLAGTVVGTKVQYGATPAAYAQGQGLYTPANAGKLFDQSAVAATGIPKEVIPPTAGQRWAYQVVPNGNSTDANEQLQLVFKLSNLAAKAGSSVNFGTGDQFITVRGFKDGSGNIVELEKGKIYTISKADFTFDESNLSTIPNTSAVSVWLKVTVKAWTVVPVKPNL